MTNYTAVFSGKDGDKKPSTVEVMQNAIETALVFDCYYEDDSSYTFVAGDVVTGSYLNNASPTDVYAIAGTITPTIGGSTMSWARDATDVGTPGEFTLAFKVVSAGADPDYSLLITYRVIATPDGVAAPASPLVGVSATEAAWLTAATLGNVVTDIVSFNEAYAPTALEPVASMFWNGDDSALEFVVDQYGNISIGKEIWDIMHNLSGAQVVDGDVVSGVGASGNRKAFVLTDATDKAKSRACIGMVTVPTINDNAPGRITKQGEVRGLNTIAYPEGTEIFVDPLNDGKWTATEPAAGNYIISIGVVLVSHATEGVVNVNIRIIPKMSELSDVNGTALTTSGQINVWNEAANYWDATSNISDFDPAGSAAAAIVTANAAAVALVDDLSGVTDAETARSNINAAAIPSLLMSDIFTTDRAAGAVNGTTAEPSSGYTRTVSDTGTNITISSKRLNMAGSTAYGVNGIIYSGVARASMVAVEFEITMPATAQIFYFGLTDTAVLPTNPAFTKAIFFVQSGFLIGVGGEGSYFYTLAAYKAGQTYGFRIEPLDSGTNSYSFYIRGADYGQDWHYIGTGVNDAAATLYPFVDTYSATIAVRSVSVVERDSNYTEAVLLSSQYRDEETFGRKNLRDWKAQLAKIQNADGTSQARVLFLGDSWTYQIFNDFYDWSIAEYGDVGRGYAPLGSGQSADIPITELGTWVDVGAATPGYGVNLSSKSSIDDATPASLAFTQVCTNITIHYIKQVGGGDFRYRVDGGAWTTVNTVNGSTLYATEAISGLASAAHTFDIEVLAASSNGIILAGVEFYKTGNGALSLYGGQGGTKASHWVSADSAIWEDALQALAPNLVVFITGTNDAAAGVVPGGQFTTDIQTIVSRIRAALPLADILLFPSADNGGGYTYSMALYDDEQYQKAVDNAISYVSGYRTIPSYANGNSRGLYENTTHPNDDGYMVLANELIRFVNER